eukprot:s1517_g15.t1
MQTLRLKADLAKKHQLFRATSASKVVADLAVQLIWDLLGISHGSSQESSDHSLYDSLEPVTEVEIFISHSWSCPSWMKALAVCHHLNLDVAIVSACLATLLSVSILVFRAGSFSGVAQQSQGLLFSCLICWPVVSFLIAYFLGHTAFVRKSFWIDRVCVDQEKKETKAEILDAIPAFVAQSAQMLVLCDSTYFGDQMHYLPVVITGCLLSIAKGAAVCCGYVWFLPSADRNKLQHAITGNGPGGSRATARKRRQKQQTHQSGINLDQVGELLQLLSQLVSILNKAGGGGNLLQTLLGLGIGTGNKPKDSSPKRKPKKKQGTGGGTGGKQTTAPLSTAKHTLGVGGGSNTGRTTGTPATAQHMTSTDSEHKTDGKTQQQPKTGKLNSGPKTFADVVASNTDFQPVWILREADWTATVFTFDAFASALDKPDALSAVVHVDSEDQLSELKVMLDGEIEKTRMLNVTAVLLAPRGAKNVDGRQLRTVPGKRGGKVQPRSAYLINLKGQGPTLKQKCVVSDAPVTTPETVVLRISVEAKYLQTKEWKTIQSKPKVAAQSWINKHVPTHVSSKILDTWAFQEESLKGGGKPAITGLLRIEKTAVKGLLACSGRFDWFVEPLKWDDSTTPSCNVEWVKKPPDLDGPAYLKKVQSLAGDLGIARGWSSLGVRKPRTEEPDARPRSWRITGVPRDWASSTLLQEVAGAGLQDMKVLSKKTLGRQAEWWVQANASKDIDFLEIIAGQHTIIIVAAPRQRLQRRTTKKLASDGRIHFTGVLDTASNVSPPVISTPGKSFYIGTPIKAKAANVPVEKPTAVAEKAAGEGDETRNAAEAADGGGEKRPPNTPSKDRPAKRIAVESKPPHDLVAKPNSGAGNCVFEALGQALSKSGRSVRASIVNHLRKYSDRYLAWWDRKEPTEQEDNCASWEVYLSMLSKLGAWGGSLELAAAAVHFDRAVIVFQPKGVPEIYNSQGKAGDPIALWYRANHYEMLEGTVPPSLMLQAAPGPLQGGRGGSESAFSSGGATRISALPPAPAGNSQRQKRPRSVTPLPSSSCSKRRSKAPSATASLGRGVSTVDDGDDSDFDGARQSDKKDIRKEWKCPLCDYETGVNKNWSQMKRAHVLAWHPAEATQLNLKAGPELQTILPDVQCKWKCPLCDLGVPAAAKVTKDQLCRMKAKHRETCHPEADLQLFRADKKWRVANAAKATHHVRAAAMACRLLGLKKGDAGAHDPVFVTIPITGKQKKKRGGMSKAICKKCGTMAQHARELATMPCEKIASSRGPRRKQLIARLRDCLKQPAISPELKRGAQTVLNIIDVSGGNSTDTAGANKHQFEAIVWPADFSVKFACLKCKRCVLRERGITPCTGKITWNQLRKGQKAVLEKYAKREPGSRQRAAVRALEILGFKEGEADCS